MFRSAINFLLLAVATKSLLASPIVQITASASPVADGYSYSYGLMNSATSSDSVFAFTLFAVSGIKDGSVLSPLGWTSDIDLIAHTIDWVSSDQPFDLQPGSFLVGFGFVSSGMPTQVVFIADGSDPATGDPTGNFASGQTSGPANTPEASTVVLTLIGLTPLIYARAWKSRSKTAHDKLS